MSPGMGPFVNFVTFSRGRGSSAVRRKCDGLGGQPQCVKLHYFFAPKFCVCAFFLQLNFVFVRICGRQKLCRVCARFASLSVALSGRPSKVFFFDFWREILGFISGYFFWFWEVWRHIAGGFYPSVTKVWLRGEGVIDPKKVWRNLRMVPMDTPPRCRRCEQTGFEIAWFHYANANSFALFCLTLSLNL